jgi:hypothetical protein
MESLEGHFQGGGRQKHSEKGKEKQTHLDIKGRGEQAISESGRKVGRSKEAKLRNKKKN